MQLELVLINEDLVVVIHLELNLFHSLVELRELSIESAFHVFHALASLHGCIVWVGGALKGDGVVANSWEMLGEEGCE